ncbi:putative extracellular matrix binding protein, partial [Apilactobacillus kunkeei]
MDDQKASAKANLDSEAAKVKKEIENDKTLTKADKKRQVKNVNKVKAEEQAKIDRENNADGIVKAYHHGVDRIKAQHVKKDNNSGKPKKKFTSRRVYMVKGFYRYSNATFYKKNRVKGYKKHGRPNAVMFTIVGEAKSKHGLKRY